MSLTGLIALVCLLGFVLLGAFSRLTHGRHTPRFYAYQLERAPDDASTWFIPYLDLTVAALLAYQPTRGVAAALCAVFQFYGTVLMVRADKNGATDLAGTMCALLLCLDCLLEES